MNDYNGGRTMQDKVEKLSNGSIIQHGKNSNRIYLMKMANGNALETIEQLNTLARQKSYTKIFCKVADYAAPIFKASGFITEAFIPGFFQHTGNVHFMSKFLNSDRLLGIELEKYETLSQMIAEPQSSLNANIPNGYTIRRLSTEDARAITEVYQQVFASYPFPIHNPDYITETMKNDVAYFGAKYKGKLVALSSAEMDRQNGNAEMTDFATLPEARGLKLASVLLQKMETEMQADKIYCAYTIARLNEPAMNKTFINNEYTYSGTLINNTQIAGSIESMNVFYKNLE